jgi:hypothetical protein
MKREDYDRMKEMLEDVWHELIPNDSEDPPRPQAWGSTYVGGWGSSSSLRLLKSHCISTQKWCVLIFITALMNIKSKFAFSNNCYKKLVNLISDVFPMNHKMPKDMYQSDFEKWLLGLGMDYEEIDVCDNNCMLFLERDHKWEEVCNMWRGEIRRCCKRGWCDHDNRGTIGDCFVTCFLYLN